MIKNIVFDIGGVIVPLNRLACIRAFDRLMNYRDIALMLSTYRRKGYFEKFELGQLSSSKFRYVIRTNAFTSQDDRTKIYSDDLIDDCLNRYLGDIPQDKIDALNFFKYEYKLYVLSNANPIGMKRVEELFENMGYKMDEIFEKQFLSYKMGLIKPDLKIFNVMQKKAKIKPEETLFIDDSPANIKAANSLGYHTILYNNKENLYDTIYQFFERQQW